MRWFFPLGYSSVMLILLLMPPGGFGEALKQIPPEIIGIRFDHIVHVCLFLGFTASWIIANVPWRKMAAFSVCIAGSSEILQYLSGRHPSLDDFAANVIGVVCGVFFAIIALWLQQLLSNRVISSND